LSGHSLKEEAKRRFPEGIEAGKRLSFSPLIAGGSEFKMNKGAAFYAGQ